MAEGNRFSNLMGGLKSSDNKGTAEPVEKKQEKAKAKAKVSKKKPPTAKSKADPKMPRVAKGSIAKSKNPDFEKGTYYLPKTITHSMRIYAATEQIEMSDLVSLAVAEYIENHSS